MTRVVIAQRETKSRSDRLALASVRVLRWGMDFATGYQHPPPGKEGQAEFRMVERKWLTRFIFLESVAGVPGMVAGMLRHLRSLRRMKRDHGWYEHGPSRLHQAWN